MRILPALILTFISLRPTAHGENEYDTSFEDIPPGPINRVELKGWTWSAAKGHAEINQNYAQTGKMSLRIFGGEERSVQLRFPSPLATEQQLRFAGERWTKRPPFSFHIDAQFNGEWKLVHDGADLQVGARFLSNVRTSLPAGTSAVRFRVSSAEPADKAGLLIDNLSIGPLTNEERLLDQLERSEVYSWEESSGFGYRIPALVVTKKGHILAFAERRTGLKDHAKNDIVLRISEDGGKTWAPEQVLAEEGGDSLNDPCAVVLGSGRVILRYTRYPENYHTVAAHGWKLAEPGYGGPRNVRVYLMHSDDGGRTWSAPRDVTRTFRPEHAINVASPGCGIQLRLEGKRDRILMPQNELRYIEGKRRWDTRVAISDDNGETWRLGSPVPEPEDLTGLGNECQVVEMADGKLLMSARSQGANLRRLATSSDFGETWSDYRLEEDLVTTPCMGAVISHPGHGLLHSLPSGQGRSRGVIYTGADSGEQWKPLFTIEPDGFAYSCLYLMPEGDVGCLYETDGYRRIVFSRIPAALLKTPRKDR